ncbi:MAG TPA: hypothetical protein HPQ03_11775 [Deltaproteobacteria bacterium]|nr:hypothetical protein [Deltaproteobacteria bacterium]
MNKKKSIAQLIWGISLALAGIGMFYRIPQVMPKIEGMEQFSSLTIYIRFCFYFIGIVLICGGGKKVYDHYPRS